MPARCRRPVVNPSASRLSSTSEFHLYARHTVQAAKTENTDLVRFAAMSKATKPTKMSRLRTEKIVRRDTMGVHSVAHQVRHRGDRHAQAYRPPPPVREDHPRTRP